MINIPNIRKPLSLFSLCLFFRISVGCWSLAALFQLRTVSSWCLSEFIPSETPDSPAHQTLPRRASGPNSQLKTHYWAISRLVMPSNDLISLSVNPVSHQRAPVGCKGPIPRVLAAPGVSLPHRLIPSSSKTGLKPQSLTGKVTGGHRGRETLEWKCWTFHIPRPLY